MVMEAMVYVTGVVGFSFPCLAGCANAIVGVQKKMHPKRGGCGAAALRCVRDATLCCAGGVAKIARAKAVQKARTPVIDMSASSHQTDLHSEVTLVTGSVGHLQNICITDHFLLIGDVTPEPGAPGYKEIVPLGGLQVDVAGNSVTLDRPIQLRFSSQQDAETWGAKLKEVGMAESPSAQIKDLNVQLLKKDRLIKAISSGGSGAEIAEESNGNSMALAGMMSEKDNELAKLQGELGAAQMRVSNLTREKTMLEQKVSSLGAASLARTAAAVVPTAAALSVSPSPAAVWSSPPPAQPPQSLQASAPESSPAAPLGSESWTRAAAPSARASRAPPLAQAPARAEARWAPSQPSGMLRSNFAALPETRASPSAAPPMVFASPPAAAPASFNTNVLRQRSAPPLALPIGSKSDEGFSGDVRVLKDICDANPELKTKWFLNEATIENVRLWPGITCSEKGNSGRVFGLRVNIRVLPDSVGELTALITLDLSNCTELTLVPDTIGKLTALTTLKCMGCTNLSRLPEGIGNLCELKTLSLGGCEKLTTLPHRLGDLRALRQLDLWRCASLVRLPDSIGGLERLEKLKLMRCSSLTILPDRIGDLRALTMLDLWECNRLVTLPNRLGDLARLTKLDLRGCNALRKESGGALSRLRASGCEIVVERLPDNSSNPSLSRLNNQS